MKKLTLTAALLCGMLYSIAQLNVNAINKRMVEISDGLHIDKYEISNADYKQFLNEIKAISETQYLEASIKSQHWVDLLTSAEPFVNYYSTHEAYQNYPVVNIDYQAAVAYCEWLSQAYNTNTDRKYQKVTFRLPTQEEWTLAANGGNTKLKYPWGNKKMHNGKGHYYCNFIINKSANVQTITAPVHSYTKSVKGLYNLSGNVAEMTNEKGIAIGGSWNDDCTKMAINTQKNLTHYPQAMPTIGFRVLMEVIEK